ncbi:MAG: TIGR00159 family protein [Chloroflexi bacterium]|nr:TIGR00159 family protein [Chloroflexota bacterium]
MRWLDILDILLVMSIFYGLLRLVQGTRAVQLLRGILVVAVITTLLASFGQLKALSWLLRQMLPALLIAIPVVFQPELRRALERLGRTELLFGRSARRQTADIVIERVSQTAQYLSEQRWGALIVLERETGLQDYVESGTGIDAQVSTELLTTVFYPGTALHDGAVIVREGRVAAAGCVLPLAEENSIGYALGTRHRAALGLSQQTDAVVVVVSEETGIVSVMYNGKMIRRLTERRLTHVLRTFYQPPPPSRPLDRLEQFVQGRGKAKRE